MSIYEIPTTQGKIAVWDTAGGGPAVLCIHGNSACKEIFSRQFESDLAQKYRFIALDLPGHGASDRAIDPERVYNFEGYADVVIEIIQALQLVRPVILGWSLGGHIGLSLLQKSQKLAGLLITGTPPIKVSPEGFEEGFLPLPLFKTLFSQITFSREQAREFMSAGGIDIEKHPFIVEAALKTDGYARSYLALSMAKGVGGDQKAVVETDETPLCIIQGALDQGINNHYIIEHVKYKNLFGRVHVIPDAGHAVFWDKPDEFNSILELFLSHVTSAIPISEPK